MAEKGLTRLTVYRLAQLDIDVVSIPSYKLAAKGKVTVKATSVSYRLLFCKRGPYEPAWLSAFDSLKLLLSDDDLPEAITSGFVLLANVGQSTYAVTGGVGHIHVRTNVAIEHRFGIDLAQRMLAINDLKGLLQRDTSGVVNTIDRNFRARYDPKGDLNNLRRVLKHLRGAFAKQNPLYRTIGSSIQASDALTVSGRKQFKDIISFLVEVEGVWSTAPKQLSIPQLEHINKKAHGPLLDDLEARLVSDLLKYDSHHTHAFFLDNADIGYLPDRAIQYHLMHDGSTWDAASYQDVLAHTRDILAGEKAAARCDLFRQLRLRVDFEDGFSETHALQYFLCGDVLCNGDVYFLDNEEWYRVSRGAQTQPPVSAPNPAIEEIRIRLVGFVASVVLAEAWDGESTQDGCGGFDLHVAGAGFISAADCPAAEN